MSARNDQHFLVDQRAVERIAGAIEVAGKRVLEVGPGKGALTEALLSRGALVAAVEIDQNLVVSLAFDYADEIRSGRLTLIQGDAVRCILPPFDVVVSNLPYSASSKITFRLLDTGFREAVLMYQSEFAQRMLAYPGTPDCGRLSIMVQTFCAARRLFDLPPQAFSPAPQVRSTVVHLIPRDPLFPINDRSLYADIVKALFSQRRKTVRNGLKSAKWIIGQEMLEQILAGLPEEILASRPEALYLEDFATIANLGCP